MSSTNFFSIEIRYAPGGDENDAHLSHTLRLSSIEIRYAPGGDENKYCKFHKKSTANALRLDMPREGTKTRFSETIIDDKEKELRLDMPREGTKTQFLGFFIHITSIEIRYAPGGDENLILVAFALTSVTLRLDMPREGTKTIGSLFNITGRCIEIRYAPGGDENLHSQVPLHSQVLH